MFRFWTVADTQAHPESVIAPSSVEIAKTEEKPVESAVKPVEPKTEEKPVDGKPKTESTEGDKPQAPAKYELTVPEGGHVDEADAKALETIARAKNWTNDQAQQALTEHAASLAAQSGRFREELNAHAEIGGDKLPVTETTVRAVLDRFLPASQPEGARLRADLTKNGYGNYAPLVLLLARIGHAMGEDKPGQQSGGGGNKPKSQEDVLYGSDKK